MSFKLNWTTNDKLVTGKGATVQEYVAHVDSRTLQIEVTPWGEGRLKVNGDQIAHIDDVKDSRQTFRKLETIADQYLKGQLSAVKGNQKPSMIPVVKAKLLEGKKGLVVGIANETRSPGAAPRHFVRSARRWPSPI